MNKTLIRLVSQGQFLVKVTALFLMISTTSLNATIIGGVDFPQGDISFADAVVSYNPDAGGTVPTVANSDPSNALGVPEVAGSTSVGACSGTPADCPFVSLGDGGSITLQFTDNLLTGSDDASFDLWIFEVGPDVEDTFVEISKNGTDWFDIGKVFGTTSGIDIDSFFGFSSADLFGYVRLTDDTNEGDQSGLSVGADIDAVGAISTVQHSVPEPSVIALFSLGLFGVGVARRKKA